MNDLHKAMNVLDKMRSDNIEPDIYVSNPAFYVPQ